MQVLLMRPAALAPVVLVQVQLLEMGLDPCKPCRRPRLTRHLPPRPPRLQLSQQLGSNPALAAGGAAHAEGAEEERAEWAEFLASLRAFAALERPWTLELTGGRRPLAGWQPFGAPPILLRMQRTTAS